MPASITFTEVQDAASLSLFEDAPGCAPLAPEAFAVCPPDVHLMRFENVGGGLDWLTARCSLWWTHAPTHDGGSLGLVGHYAAETETAGRALLGEALGRLRRAGCVRAAGPMDGATWQPYRFVVDDASGGTRPPFFLEPAHSPAHAQHFRAAGFAPWMHFRSTQVPLQGGSSPIDRDVPWTLRALRPGQFEREVTRCYRLARTSFAGSPLYTPLPEVVFRRQCERLRPHLGPGLTRLAVREGRPVGFCLAVPDRRQHENGRPVDTVVLKTLAVHPSVRRQGLGAHLVADVHRQARAQGYRHVIHALMREGNASNRISDAFGARPLRRYALFARPLS